MMQIIRKLSIAVALVMAGFGLTSHSALADVSISWFDPPPLCTEQPGTGCVAQPNPKYDPSVSSPILIDMPTMRLDINETVTGGIPELEDVTGVVTFTITDGGSTPSGYRFTEAEWPLRISLYPIADKSDPSAFHFSVYQRQWVIDGTRDDCEGKITCTYVTEESPPLPAGWFIAGGANGYVVQKGGLTSFGNPGPNAATGSMSAVYIPQVEDLDPPYVEIETTGSGLTAKAIAQAQDPGEQAMSLHWDFGDGATQVGSFGAVVTHVYATPGDFVITAIATAADGRKGSASSPAMVLPPRPILQAVARNGSSTTGVAAGTLQGWPDGAMAEVRYWTGGCPVDPDIDYEFADGFSVDAKPTAESTVSMDFNYLDPAANAFVLLAEALVPAGPSDTVEIRQVSECVEMTPGRVYETTAETTIGATEMPVDSASVPIGNVVVIDAGADDSKQDLSEQREVTGHGSLFVAPLDRGHPSGAYVIDAGQPLAPYVLPPPPEEPVLGLDGPPGPNPVPPAGPDTAPIPALSMAGVALLLLGMLGFGLMNLRREIKGTHLL